MRQGSTPVASAYQANSVNAVSSPASPALIASTRGVRPIPPADENAVDHQEDEEAGHQRGRAHVNFGLNEIMQQSQNRDAIDEAMQHLPFLSQFADG